MWDHTRDVPAPALHNVAWAWLTPASYVRNSVTWLLTTMKLNHVNVIKPYYKDKEFSNAIISQLGHFTVTYALEITYVYCMRSGNTQLCGGHVPPNSTISALTLTD